MSVCRGWATGCHSRNLVGVLGFATLITLVAFLGLPVSVSGPWALNRASTAKGSSRSESSYSPKVRWIFSSRERVGIRLLTLNPMCWRRLTAASLAFFSALTPLFGWLLFMPDPEVVASTVPTGLGALFKGLPGPGPFKKCPIGVS